MQALYILTLAGALLAGAAPAGAAEPMTAQQLLEATDRSRGGGLPGVAWDLKITAVDPDAGENVRMMRVKADGDNSVAETYFPARSAGGRLLQLGRNMWYGRPDIQKPVSISSRQKMMGPAANGDRAPKLIRNAGSPTATSPRPTTSRNTTPRCCPRTRSTASRCTCSTWSARTSG